MDSERNRHSSRTIAWMTLDSGPVTIVKASVGAYVDMGALQDESGIAVVAGKCLLSETIPLEPADCRDRELSHLRAAVRPEEQRSLLRRSRGTFAIAMYEAGSRTLLLATDRLGVRPVYFAKVPEGLVFSTSLSAISGSGMVPVEVDHQGFSERLHLGYCLDDRTEIAGVKVLRGGEALRATESGAAREQYFDLLDCAEGRQSKAADPGRVFRAFTDAVKVRLGSDSSAVAFLSGGLDSRAVCAALRESGAELTTISYGVPGSQDCAFGELMAARLGARHHVVPQSHLDVGDSHSKRSVLPALLAEGRERECGPPRMIWSGDGGSVGLGMVYLSDDATSAAERKGRLLPAMQIVQPPSAYLGAFRNATRARLEALLAEGLVNEEERLAPLQPLLALYLFLMRNDQRRHLHAHYDRVLDGGIDLQLPFFDADFVELMVEEPLSHYLRHVGYMEFLARFSQPVLEVPWQAYPGHVGCSLPLPADLTYQWGGRRNPHLVKQWRNASLAGFRQTVFRYPHVRREVRLLPLLLGWGRQVLSREEDYSYIIRGPSLLAALRANAAASNETGV